jgi:hypothetical protein
MPEILLQLTLNTNIRGVPILVGRLIHENKNPTSNETWEAA